MDEEIVNKYQETQRWAASRDFTLAAKSEFAQVADAYLVATAAAKQMVVVTYETPDSKARKRVKIPDACVALGVQYCDLNAVFRNLNVII